MCKHLFYRTKRDSVDIYNLLFEGYWTDSSRSEIPSLPGIYCVYESKCNSVWKNVSIKNLIYIGKSENVNIQLANNQCNSDWAKFIRPGCQLGYSFAEVDPEDLERIESAFVFRHKPVGNPEHRKIFPFEMTIIRSTGATALLCDFFKIDKKI
jgi:hypothetical protein